MENKEQKSKSEKFSYSALIMSGVKRIQELAGREKREGYYSTETSADGSKKMVYQDNPIRQYIESVDSLRLDLSPEIDKEAEKKIKILLDEEAEIKKKLMNDEVIWWNNLKPTERKYWVREKKVMVIEGVFSTELQFIRLFSFEQYRIAKEMYQILIKLINRINLEGK